MVPIPVIAQRVADYYQISLGNLKDRRTPHDDQVASVAKRIAMVLASREGWKEKPIAEYLGLDRSTVSRAIRLTTEDAQRHPKTEALLELLSA
jgi:chromosomal replication initiation ATPase DnaA